MDFVIDDDLEMKLRMKALTKHGGKKGSLVTALQEAISQYVDEDPTDKATEVIKDKTSGRTARLHAVAAVADSGNGVRKLLDLSTNPQLDLLSQETILNQLSRMPEVTGSALKEAWAALENRRRRQAAGKVSQPDAS